MTIGRTHRRPVNSPACEWYKYVLRAERSCTRIRTSRPQTGLWVLVPSKREGVMDGPVSNTIFLFTLIYSLSHFLKTQQPGHTVRQIMANDPKARALAWSEYPTLILESMGDDR